MNVKNCKGQCGEQLVRRANFRRLPSGGYADKCFICERLRPAVSRRKRQ